MIMIRIIMHGCNGRMGQAITRLVKEDEGVKIVAGIDPFDGIVNDYPVYKNIKECWNGKEIVDMRKKTYMNKLDCLNTCYLSDKIKHNI